MRYGLLIFVFILNTSLALAQFDTITTRDTIELNYQIKATIIPAYQNLLGLIAYPDMGQNEIEALINNNVKGNSEQKLFYDDKVIIQNDLTPGADKDKLLSGDIEVGEYLKNFYTTYSKSETNNITLTVNKISTLKKADYLYYNVGFDCEYGGSTTSGKTYSKFSRVAEMRVVKENKWRLYIGAIRFPASKGKDFDTTNIYHGIVESNGDLERILRSISDEKAAKKLADEKKIKTFNFDGDVAFDEKKFDVALSKYHEAFMVNPNDKETLEKLDKTRKAIEEKKRQELAEIAKQKHIAEMKINAKKEKNNYNFKLAKLYCDSLTKDFGVTDADIVKLGEKMSNINSSLTGIEIALESKNYSDALNKCDAEIKKAKLKKDSISISEFNYQAAKVSVANADKDSRIFEYLNDAILFSDAHHQEALKIRAKMFVKSAKIPDAIQDATHIIENDSRNPVNYIYLADICDNNNFPDRALENYSKAIIYKTDNQLAYINKARLEYNKQKYFDAVKTCSDGITLFKIPNGLLYYYRGLAYVEINNFATAGKDFRAAIMVNIPDKEKAKIHEISNAMALKGNEQFRMLHFSAAIAEYSKSIAVDSSVDAMYSRGCTYIRTDKSDSAIVDLRLVIRHNPKYFDAYRYLGVALTNIEMYPEALLSFKSELVNYPTNSLAFYYKGQCELKQKNYTAATLSFESAAALIPSDSAFYYDSYAYYQMKNYDAAIAKSQSARKYNTKRFEVYYICGKAYYDKKNYSSAIKEFETAKTLVTRNDDLFFSHAIALEKNENFDKASTAYSMLFFGGVYKDTALLRSGICMVKKHDETKYSDAILCFNNYINKAAYPNKAEAFAYMAYTNLYMNNALKTKEAVEAARRENDKDAMLQYVLACQSANDNKESDAFMYLDKALESHLFSQDEVKGEKYFKSIKKNEKFKTLLVKYF